MEKIEVARKGYFIAVIDGKGFLSGTKRVSYTVVDLDNLFVVPIMCSCSDCFSGGYYPVVSALVDIGIKTLVVDTNHYFDSDLKFKLGSEKISPVTFVPGSEVYDVFYEDYHFISATEFSSKMDMVLSLLRCTSFLFEDEGVSQSNSAPLILVRRISRLTLKALKELDGFDSIEFLKRASCCIGKPIRDINTEKLLNGLV